MFSLPGWHLLDCKCGQSNKHLPVLPGGHIPDGDWHAVQPGLHSLLCWKLRNRDRVHTGLQLFGVCRWDVRANGWLDSMRIVSAWNILGLPWG